MTVIIAILGGWILASVARIGEAMVFMFLGRVLCCSCCRRQRLAETQLCQRCSGSLAHPCAAEPPRRLPRSKMVRDMSIQAQTTYTAVRGSENPRFNGVCGFHGLVAPGTNYVVVETEESSLQFHWARVLVSQCNGHMAESSSHL